MEVLATASTTRSGNLVWKKAELVLKVMATVAWIRGLEVKMADLKHERPRFKSC